ncbi:hypothetical protein KVR01_006659 [Diaporthe batatas]|uniref:uncharacterized protein n=1 Tax=Diaporthe batatas TaxID=748121 RepID=UPI001D03A09B|nr:uncharacterized protein KVR01_006659 [Diaporthe batatas]KAG8163362.1 hypothetical protein KVR01_006659 [Diaporthe batatas]
MERPVKRQRIALDSLGTDDEDEDELECEPNELNQRRDPVYQLEQARARASDKLKSRFESIFSKYGKDFTGIGDEIDLRTGQVVVDNGHLQSITAVQEFGQGGEGEQEDAHCSGDDLIVHGIRDEAFGDGSSDVAARSDPKIVVHPTSGVAPAPQSLTPPCQPFGLWEVRRTQVVDPAWRTPELPQSAFMSTRFVSQAQQPIFGTRRVTRVTGGPLTKTRDQDGDEEDVLLGAPDNLLGAKGSPLIKSKFPAVGSSPDNDPGLHEMIQDVIENIAATSPSADQSRRKVLGTRPTSKPGVKSASSNTDNYCMQAKGKTSEARSRSASSPIAVSPCQREQAPRHAKRKRGHTVARRKTRQPKDPAEQQLAGPKEDPDATGMEEDFLDVTGNTPIKPSGRTFYVEIKARKVGQLDPFAQYHGDHGSETVSRTSLGVDASHQALEPPLSSRSLGLQKPCEPPTGPGVVELAAERLDPGAMEPRTQRDVSQRKTLGPASAFAGVYEMSTSKQNGAPASTNFGSQPPQESQPSMPQKPSKEQFERNIVDPSYTFSDEENLLPRKSTIRCKSERAGAAGLAAQGASRNEYNGKASKSPPTSVALDASLQRKRNRVARISPQPGPEHDAAARATGASGPSREPRPDHVVYGSTSDVAKHSLHRRTRSKRQRPEEQGLEERGQKATSKAECQPLRSRCQNGPGNDLQGLPGLIEEPSPVVASSTAPAEDGSASAKSPQTAESAPLAPSTPRPKCRPRPEKPKASGPGLISLLSDDEDDEDEISFHLADFTPSGYHRILALRQDADPPPTASAGKKMRVASLLFGPSSCSKADKHSTPGCRNKNRESRRRSTNDLTGGVVNSTRAPSPSVSVVQTPGGTKRRCGEGGFRCGRDFCFACISI